MIMQVYRPEVKVLIIIPLLFLMLSITGCSKNKDDQTLTVYPVLNNRFANSYIAADQGEAIIIDPSDPEQIISILTQNKLTPSFIVLTHGHFDHILGVDSLVSRFPETKVLIHPLDQEKLADPEKNLSYLSGRRIKSRADSSPVTEKEIITIGNSKIKVVETPGHSEGSIILMSGKVLFSGDTLFKGSVGRTDFPGSSGQDLTESLKKITSLSGDLTIYPGHGEITSLKEEKENNPFLRQNY